MSRVECDQCGARYESAAPDPANEVDARPSPRCRECGAAVHSSQDDRITMPMPLGGAKVEEPASDSPDTTRSTPEVAPPTVRVAELPMDTLPDAEAEAGSTDAERDTVVTNPPFSEPPPPDSGIPVSVGSLEYLDGGPPSNAARDAASGGDEPALPEEETIPVSGTPSIAVLVERARNGKVGANDENRADMAAASDSPPYDRRPPDIRMETNRDDDDGATPLAPRLTDAPVSETKHPPAPERPSSKRSTLLALAVLGAAGAIVVVRALDEESVTASGAAAPPAEIVEASKPANEPISAPPAPAVQAPTEAAAEETAPATITAAQQLKPVGRAGGAPSEARKVTSAPVARSQEPESPAAEPAPVEAAFDANAANAALDSTVTQAGTCRKGTDPSGVATVTVTFSTTGRVTSATVSGPPFAGTETGSCIASTLRTAKVPPFSGEFMTVKKTVTIR